MIGRKSRRDKALPETDVGPRGFDDFDLRLGDLMRGERATMGKSLLDVQRELRIKAAYIAAIENCDPEAFDTPGFIAGYVRSYARYLGMDPDSTFQKFCAESGFITAHGMSADASSARKPSAPLTTRASGERDIFKDPNMPFTPANDSILSRIEPGAVGSMMVLLMLIAGIGYGGWSVLQEIQRVQLTPVDQTPIALAELDPLEGAGRIAPQAGSPTRIRCAQRGSLPRRPRSRWTGFTAHKLLMCRC
ncbi:helix-turn-helix transcriptional regulator [Phaeobacter sp. J2-8]|uniref:helix-turn-helix domain-containing protein n=1 Tax=Phaeobacter sp. J2-8 TaxID=2931394 RepID=UPI0032AFFDC0